MAQFTHRADIVNADFPLLSEDMGRTVMVPTVQGEQSENAAPQIFYAHNVMPTKEGMVSVGYTQVVAAVSNDAFLDDVRIIFGNAGTRLEFCVSENGSVYILKPNATTWLEIPFTGDVAGKLLTTGTVNGITYIYFQDVGCFTYNEAADLFTPVVLSALNLSDTVGITASYGYLLAYTIKALAWSSTVSPTDFTPSAVTGAGGGGVADADGDILFAVPNSLGILIYTAANVVAATFTGNKQYPFKVREVENSAGALNLDLVAYEANATKHFSLGKSGVQAIDSRTATTFLPEVTDFLGGERIEDFDESTLTFSVEDLAEGMLKKVKLISSRYLVISYGKTEFTHALIYDLILERLGKIRFTHSDVFEYIGGVHNEVIKHTLAFLQPDGCVHILDFALSDTSEGVLLLGRFQYVRSRTLSLQQVDVSNVHALDTFNVHALPSFNGTDLLTPVTGYLAESGTKMRRYNFDMEGLNVVLALIGKMDLNSVVLTFTPGGKQ